MPSQDAKHAPEEARERRLSRRSLLQGAAAAGAAGPALAATAATTGSSPPAPDQAPGRAPAGPIMVHVRDTRSGDIEVFAGTSQTRLRDQELAARIARAIG